MGKTYKCCQDHAANLRAENETLRRFVTLVKRGLSNGSIKSKLIVEIEATGDGREWKIVSLEQAAEAALSSTKTTA